MAQHSQVLNVAQIVVSRPSTRSDLHRLDRMLSFNEKFGCCGQLPILSPTPDNPMTFHVRLVDWCLPPATGGKYHETRPFSWQRQSERCCGVCILADSVDVNAHDLLPNHERANNVGYRTTDLIVRDSCDLLDGSGELGRHACTCGRSISRSLHCVICRLGPTDSLFAPIGRASLIALFLTLPLCRCGSVSYRSHVRDLS